MSPEPRSLAEWLEAEMIRGGITTKGQVAIKIDVSPTTITNLFDGKPISLDTLYKLSVGFHVDLDYLKSLAYWSPVRSKRRAVDKTPTTTSLGSSNVIMIPVQHSTVSAGFGNYSDFEVIPYVPKSHERGHRFTALVVSGDCLSPDILPGHTVIVDLDASPMPGNTVVVEQDQEILAKKLEKRNGDLWLVARQGRDPIKVDETIKILGVVTWIGHEP